MAHADPRGLSTLGKHLRQALSSKERDEALALLLEVLDAEGRERLLEMLPEETAEALRTALSTAKGQTAPAGRRKLERIWERFLSRWEETLLDTGDEGGPYVSEDPHWEPPWLDGSCVEADLEKAAREVIVHLPGIVGARIDGIPGPGEFLADSCGQFGAGLPDWFGDTEDQFSLGPLASELICRWSLERSLRDGVDGFRAAAVLLELLASVETWMDPSGIHAALTALPEAGQAELVDGLASPAGVARFGKLLDDPRTPWARVFDELATRHRPDLALARDREGIDRATAAVAGGPVDLERELVVARLLEEHRRVDEEALTRLFERAARSAAAEGRTAREQAAWLQAAAGEGVRRWEGLAQAFRAVPKRFAAVRDALFAGVKDAVAVLVLPRELVRDPVARYTDALLDGLVAGAGGREGAVTRLRALVTGAGSDEQSFDRYRGALADLALDLAGEEGHEGKERLHDLLVEVAGCLWEAAELRDSRRAAVRALDAEWLLPQVHSVLREYAGRLVPDPAGAHKSRYERHARALAGVAELDERAAGLILDGWLEAHRRRRNLWAALRAEGIDV